MRMRHYPRSFSPATPAVGLVRAPATRLSPKRRRKRRRQVLGGSGAGSDGGSGDVPGEAFCAFGDPFRVIVEYPG